MRGLNLFWACVVALDPAQLSLSGRLFGARSARIWFWGRFQRLGAAVAGSRPPAGANTGCLAAPPSRLRLRRFLLWENWPIWSTPPG